MKAAQFDQLQAQTTMIYVSLSCQTGKENWRMRKFDGRAMTVYFLEVFFSKVRTFYFSEYHSGLQISLRKLLK